MWVPSFPARCWDCPSATSLWQTWTAVSWKPHRARYPRLRRQGWVDLMFDDAMGVSENGNLPIKLAVLVGKIMTNPRVWATGVPYFQTMPMGYFSTVIVAVWLRQTKLQLSSKPHQWFKDRLRPSIGIVQVMSAGGTLGRSLHLCVAAGSWNEIYRCAKHL
jgi:hypothetical protein